MDWTPEEVKKLRQQLGWTQEKMAEELGVRRPTVADWERDVYRPSPMARKMLDQLKTTVEDDEA